MHSMFIFYSIKLLSFIIFSIFLIYFCLHTFSPSLSLCLMLTCRWRVQCESDLHLHICDSSPSHVTPALSSDSR